MSDELYFVVVESAALEIPGKRYINTPQTKVRRTFGCLKQIVFPKRNTLSS